MQEYSDKIMEAYEALYIDANLNQKKAAKYFKEHFHPLNWMD